MKPFLILLCLLFGLGSCTGSEATDNGTIEPAPGPDPDPEEPQPEPEPETFMKYYVAENGDDAAPGSIEQPFRTIGAALQRVNPGDTVLLRGGTYHEFVLPTRSGEKDKVITLMSYPGEEAKIDGSTLEITGWFKPLVRVDGVDYMTFENLHICHATNAAANTDPEGILIMGSPRGITVKGCKIYEIKSTVPQNNGSVDWRSAHAILVIGTDNNRPIRDLTIEHCEIFEIHTGTSETMTIAGNVDGFTVRNNHVHDVENIGIIIAGGDGLNPGGDISVNYARNGVVQDNRVEQCSHTKSPAYWGPTAYGAIGIYICGGANTTVERNIVTGCDRGIGLVSESDILATKDCIVRNNFVYNCYRTGIYMGDYLNFHGAGTSGCYVVNNTLYNNNSVKGALDEIDGEGEIRLTEDCTNNVIKNNVIYARPEHDIFVRKYTQTGSNNVVDYNHYYTTGSPKWMWDDVLYTDFEAWKAACKGDEHSVYGVDPMLVSTNEEAPDLHLQADSPARNTGEFTSFYIHGDTDIDGDPRMEGGTISKGADQ